MAEQKWKEPEQRPIYRFTDYVKDGKVIEPAVGKVFIGILEKKMHYTDKANGSEKNRYDVKDEKGKQWLIFGATRLDRKLKDIPDGMLVRIEYLGKAKTTKGGEAHDFVVQVPDNAQI